VVSPLAEVLMATATMDVKEEAVIEVRGQLASEEDARKLQQVLPGLLALSRLLGPPVAAKVPGEPGQMLARMAPLLGKLKPEQKGSEITGTIRTDAGEALRAILDTARRQ